MAQDHTISKDANIEEWFEGFINTLELHKLTLLTGTASKERESVYELLMSGDEKKMASFARAQSSMQFFKHIIIDYFKELAEQSVIPLKIALDFSDAKILVWAEIEDDDEATEDGLLTAEAKVNAAYHKNGFYISSTIVEKSDCLPIPTHYKEVQIREQKEIN